MVDCGGLENRWPVTGSGGSNPSFSAKASAMKLGVLGETYNLPTVGSPHCIVPRNAGTLHHPNSAIKLVETSKQIIRTKVHKHIGIRDVV